MNVSKILALSALTLGVMSNAFAIKTNNNDDDKTEWVGFKEVARGYGGVTFEPIPKLGIPLLDAISDKNLAEVKRLINAGTNVNQRHYRGKDANGRDFYFTALEIAVDTSGNEEIIEVLLKGGAKQNYRDVDGSTALMECAYNADLESLKILLRYHASPNIRDNDGKHALDHAISGKEAEIRFDGTASSRTIQTIQILRRVTR